MRRSTGFWLMACAGLGGVIALELSGELPLAPEVTAAAPAPVPVAPAAAPLVFEPPDPLVIDEIMARPLFDPARQPYVGPEADDETPEPAAAPAATFVLAGTLIAGNVPAALLARDGERARWRREGETIGGWTVARVEAGRVTLRRGAAEEVVPLRRHDVGTARAAPRTPTPQPEPPTSAPSFETPAAGDLLPPDEPPFQ